VRIKADRVSLENTQKNGRFYEVTKFESEDTGNYILVKRWGKAEQRALGGGATKIETYRSSRELDNEFVKVVGTKSRGGYERMGVLFSFPENEKELIECLQRDYSDSSFRETVYRMVTGSRSEITMMIIDDVLLDSARYEVVEESPDAHSEPEVERPEWGTW